MIEKRAFIENSSTGDKCKTEKVTLKSGTSLKYGMGCSGNSADGKKFDSECIPLSKAGLGGSDINVSDINSCQDLNDYLSKFGLQNLQLTMGDATVACDLYCDTNASTSVTTSEKSAAQITTNPGFALVFGTLLLLLIMSFKRS